MKTKWIKLAAGLLEKASDEFSNHGCNDWDFPSDWTKEEQQEFVKAMHDDNGSPQDYDPEHLHVPDWWVMTFLAKRIEQLEELDRGIEYFNSLPNRRECPKCNVKVEVIKNKNGEGVLICRHNATCKYAHLNIKED